MREEKNRLGKHCELIRCPSSIHIRSGEGITANHFALDNFVTAVEPSEEMLLNAWRDNQYNQIVGDISAISEFEDNSFDFVLCYNVLE